MKKYTTKIHNKIISIVLLTTTIGGAAVGLASCMEKKVSNDEQQAMIINYCGEDSRENDILEYLEVSQAFQNADIEATRLNMYLVDDVLNKLLSTDELMDLIEKYNTEKDPNIKGVLQDQKAYLDVYLSEAHKYLYDVYVAKLKNTCKNLYNIDSIYPEIRLSKEVNVEKNGYNYFICYGREFQNKKPIDDEGIMKSIDIMNDLKNAVSKSEAERIDIYTDAIVDGFNYGAFVSANTNVKGK